MDKIDYSRGSKSKIDLVRFPAPLVKRVVRTKGICREVDFHGSMISRV